MLAAEAAWREALRAQTLADLVRDGKARWIDERNKEAVAEVVQSVALERCGAPTGSRSPIRRGDAPRRQRACRTCAGEIGDKPVGESRRLGALLGIELIERPGGDTFQRDRRCRSDTAALGIVRPAQSAGIGSSRAACSFWNTSKTGQRKGSAFPDWLVKRRIARRGQRPARPIGRAAQISIGNTGCGRAWGARPRASGRARRRMTLMKRSTSSRVL